jgi:RNA ligase
MAKLNFIDLFFINLLVKDKFLKVQKHPKLPLRIYSYTPTTQYGSHWNYYTKLCRGLVVDEKNNIVARPLPKFFNIGQEENIEPNPDTAKIYRIPLYLKLLNKINSFTKKKAPKEGAIKVYEKLDGSLVIGFFYNNTFILASKGSLDSFVVKKANKMMKNIDTKNFKKGYTYLFELLAPETKVVVKYDKERLVLLAAINTSNGKELDIKDIDYPDKVERIEGINSLNDLPLLDSTNKEGFVIKYSNNYRLKFKFEEYKLLHYVVTGVSNKDIWKAMVYEADPINTHISWKLDLEEVLKEVPDEFYEWYNNEYTMLKNQLKDTKERVGKIANSSELEGLSRAEIYKYLDTNHKDIKAFVMAELDKKDFTIQALKTIEPEVRTPRNF